MKTATIVALTALLSAGAQAVPMAGHHHAAPAHAHLHHRNKRDIIWKTEWEVEIVTVVKTIYDDGSEPTPTGRYSPSTIGTSVAATTSSTYVAPAPSAPPPSTASTASSPAPAPSSSSTTSIYVPPPAPPAPTTTTQAPAPTTYSPEPAPTTYSQPPAPAPAPSPSAPASSPAGGSSSATGTSAGASYTGDATHWDPALGACGWTNTATEDVVALSMIQFDPETPSGNPNKNPLCGRFVNIKTSGGSTVSAKVVDRCVGCKAADLDMTLSLFNKVTNNGDGRVSGMEWSWA